MAKRQWLRHEGRSYTVTQAEYEHVRAMLRTAMHHLDRLKTSGERTGHRKL